MTRMNELTLDELDHVSGGDFSFQIFGYQVDISGAHDVVGPYGHTVHIDASIDVNKVPPPK